MTNFKQLPIITLLISLVIFSFSCTDQKEGNAEKEKAKTEQNEKLFLSTMQKHLDAVSNKDLATLESTMSPDGKMQLILPSSEIINGVDKFIEYHREWFKDTTWTFETKILNSEIGNNIGIAITEIIYREPERNGKPYFNRMTVSYALKKTADKWYIIKDHASTIEKTKTD